MKKKISFVVLALMAISFITTSCSKYEEGSASAASKKSRLVNHWVTVSIKLNGVDITGWNIITELEIRDNNTITVHGSPLGIPTQNEGTWVFDSDKSHVMVTNSDGSIDAYEIVKLEKNSLKVRDTEGNGDVYLHEYTTY